MRVLRWTVSIVLACSLPLQAQNTAGAMVYAKGKVRVDTVEIPDSQAIFTGQSLETNSDSQASMVLQGSSVLVLPDSKIRLDPEELVFYDEGEIDITTVKRIVVRAGNLTIAPAPAPSSHFDVSKRKCRVHVIARIGDVEITRGFQTETLKEGKETTFEDACPAARTKKPGAAPAAGGSLLSSWPAIVAGSGAATGVLVWVLIQGDDPISQSCPSKQSCASK